MVNFGFIDQRSHPTIWGVRQHDLPHRRPHFFPGPRRRPAAHGCPCLRDTLFTRCAAQHHRLDGRQESMLAFIFSRRRRILTASQYHKLSDEPALKAVANDVVQERTVVNEIVTSTVAMKSVAS